MDELERNEKGRTILDYISNQKIWENAIRGKDEPYKRIGTPAKVQTHFGSKLALDSKNLGIPHGDAFTPGSIWRFGYSSSFEDDRENDPFPFVLILEKESTGQVFNPSTTVRKEKYPSVFGKKYFYGLNLNYLRFDLAALYIEAINIQRVVGKFITHSSLVALNPEIPFHAFRMYYKDWCSGFRKVEVSKLNGND